MAFGQIAAIAHQNVTINTEMSLDINISGNPDFAYIVGLLEGYYTNWNDPTLEVRGAAKRLITNLPFKIIAIKGSETITRQGSMSVIPAAPVITNPGRQRLVRGIENEINIKIANSPSTVRVTGPWIGMEVQTTPDGRKISGIIPGVSHAIPNADQNIQVVAETGNLRDQTQIDFDLEDPVYAYLHRNDTIYVIFVNNHANGTVLTEDDILRTFSVHSSYSIADIAIDGDNLYLIHSSNTGLRTQVFRIDRTTPDGKTGTVGIKVLGDLDRRPGGSRGLGLDSQNFFINFYTTFKVYLRSRVNQNAVRSITLDNKTHGSGAVVDGNDFYYTARVMNQDRIVVIDKNTTSSRVNAKRTIIPPENGTIYGMDIIGNKLYAMLWAGGTGKLIIIDKNTPDGDVAVPTFTLTLPKGIYTGMALSSKN